MTERKCPFYGMYYSSRVAVFLENSGNQCALITTAHAPCQMEMQRLQPNWRGCEFNTSTIEDTVEGFVKDATVITESRGGIPFKDWYEHTVEGKPLRTLH